MEMNQIIIFLFLLILCQLNDVTDMWPGDNNICHIIIKLT